jgi:photoactive yellow protein
VEESHRVRLRELFLMLPAGLILLDRTGRALLYNAAAAELTGRALEDIADADFFRALPPTTEVQALEGAFWNAMVTTGALLDEDRELALNTAAGPRELRVRMRKILMGEEPFAVLLIDDNSRVRRTERALAAALGEAQEQAVRDPLTGLFNRRHIEAVLPGELKRAERHEAPLSLLVIDVDHFKTINDRFGHPTGDRVLVELARLLNRILRVGDTCARIGGEEFCVVLPHTGGAAAFRAAERLHRVIRALRFDEEPELRVTASIGAATAAPPFPQADLPSQVKTLFARADGALYEAKRAGRDRTVAAP